MTELKPGDGYTVQLIDSDNAIGVYFNLRLNGRYVNLPDMPATQNGTVTLGFWVAPTAFQRGEAARLYLLSDAIGRFFNTGGAWSALGVLFAQLQKAGVGMADYAPYRLISSHLTIDAIDSDDETAAPTYSYEHAYASETVTLGATTPVVIVNESAGVALGTYGELTDAGEQC